MRIPKTTSGRLTPWSILSGVVLVLGGCAPQTNEESPPSDGDVIGGSEPGGGDTQPNNPDDGNPQPDDPDDGNPQPDDPDDGNPQPDDPDDGTPQPDDPDDDTPTDEDPDFAACLAQVQQECVVPEMDTAEKIQTPCFDLTFIEVPLTNGGTHGPITVDGGPYGGKIDWNQGADTEFVNDVSLMEAFCIPYGVETFNEPKPVTDELLNTRDLDYSLYTIFRPACMKEGEEYPVITWANGTCGLTHGYGGLLATVASHGFVVIASNSTWTGSTTSPGGVPVQLRALDYAEALNEDPNSIFYQKLDLDNIGAMGHSQGSAATSSSASDSRIKSLILWNGGTSNKKPFLYVSGERDVGTSVTPTSMADRTDSATQPGAWIYHKQVLHTGGSHTGHLVLMMQPERVVDMAIAWWKWQLNGDQEAKKMFIGDNCGLCNSPDEYEYGHNSLLK
jgi:hypothetical protein